MTSIADTHVPTHHYRVKPLPDETPADFIRRVRDALGLGREKFAQELSKHGDITSKTIERIEKGGAVGKDSAITLARYTGVSVGWFMGEPEPLESRVDPIEDEALSVADQALRAMRGAHQLDPETTQRLRDRLEHVQFSTGARLSTVVSFLEDELIAMKAERRPKAEPEATPAEPKKPSKLTPREPRRGGGAEVGGR